MPIESCSSVDDVAKHLKVAWGFACRWSEQKRVRASKIGRAWKSKLPEVDGRARVRDSIVEYPGQHMEDTRK